MTNRGYSDTIKANKRAPFFDGWPRMVLESNRFLARDGYFTFKVKAMRNAMVRIITFHMYFTSNHPLS